MHNSCNPRQAEGLLIHHLNALWSDPARVADIPPLMLWGPPGIGKSSIVRSVTTRLGINLLDIRLAQREPVDLRGLPVPRGDTVSWLLPAEWPREPASRGIILFDELSAADRSLQVAAYELILDRRLGDLYRVPDGWYICAAGNRSEDHAVAGMMSSALANRFCHLDLEADPETWVHWAQETGLHPTVCAFMRVFPQHLFSLPEESERGWPSPRSWERVAHALVRAEAGHLPEDHLRLIVCGLIGPGVGTEFLAWNTEMASLPNAREMLLGHIPLRIPARADQRYALCAAMVFQLWRHADQPGVIRRFLAFGCELPGDFATMTLTDAMQHSEQHEAVRRADLLLQHPDMAAWKKQHGAAFGKGRSRRAA